ncbi:MAG: hypothetical protein H8E38_12560 [SAR324 cluster bacterium]|nr:hypothetical protein [SAR324 cluster bacterium]MBL7034847.1 hypothetical protein [SAR324 cluster bacterium]
MWFKNDYRWMLPFMGVVIMAMIVVTHWPQAGTWYDSKVDRQINQLQVEEFANWIIQGRNDFVPVTFSIEETSGIDNIPGLIQLDPQANYKQQIKQIPIYKKLVLIPQAGEIPVEIHSDLTENWERKVILLHGGAETWHARITAESVENLALTQQEERVLNSIRPFFHPALLASSEDESNDQQERYLAPEATMPPLLEEEEEEEEEEGC